MANIKFGNGWADARGKVGGVIYSKNKGGSYARNYTKPTNPRTPSQVRQRNRFSYVSSNWRLLTEQDRNAWNYAASQVPVSNKVGEKIHLTGAQYFNRQNLNIFAGGGTTIVESPSQLVDIVGLVSMEVVATVTAGVVSAVAINAIKVDGTTALVDEQHMIVFATPVLSNGVTRPQPSQYREIMELSAPSPITGIIALPDYLSNFPLFSEGNNVWFKARIYNSETGQTSQDLEAKVTYVTA